MDLQEGLNAVIAAFMFGVLGLAIAILLDFLTYKMSLSKKNGPAMAIQIALLVVLLVITVILFIVA